MNGILFFQLLSCAVITAFNLFALETIERIDVQAMASFYDFTSVLATTFIYCYLSERVTADLLIIGDLFYASLWYHLPSKQGKLLKLSIERSQWEFRLKGFELINCSLSVFLSVCDDFLGNPCKSRYCQWRMKIQRDQFELIVFSFDFSRLSSQLDRISLLCMDLNRSTLQRAFYRRKLVVFSERAFTMLQLCTQHNCLSFLKCSLGICGK